MEAPKNFIKLQQGELNISEIISLVTFSNCGAISNFIGITRDNFEDKKVIMLEYEAYESMALKEMANICDKIRSQWDVEGIAIFHRIGKVPISEASVVIAISSPHRKESLNAVEYAINTLKASVPIWKKEVYETGEPQWKENKEFHRVANMWGPQTIDQSVLRKSVTNNISFNASSSFSILDDRISATEHTIGINKPVPKDIYKRLKNIEDRILYLESVSPEYKEFWMTEDTNNLTGISKSTRKRTYSIAELDLKLYELEDKYTKKMK